MLLLLPAALATTWVVDPDGAGDATTLTDGLALMSPGDALELRPGTYLLEDAGSYEAARSDLDDITITGAGANATIVDGADLDEGMQVGLDLPGRGISISGITFRNFRTDAGAVLSGLADNRSSLTVDHCAFVANGPGLGVYGGELSVSNSTFVGNDEAVAVFNGWADSLTVQDSLFIDNRLGITPNWVDEYDEGGTLWSVVNNTFVGGDWAFAFSSQDNSYPHSLDIVFADNIVTATGVGWDIESLCASCAFTGEFSNNLIGAGVVNVIRDDNGTTDFAESGTITADPSFVNWTDDGDDSDDDLHLAFGSPGIDQGLDGYVTEDHDGAARPVDGDLDGTATTDIGAYEFSPDADGDGHDAIDAGGDDCDDEDPEAHPGAPEACDGVDADCDGADVGPGIDCDPVGDDNDEGRCGCAAARVPEAGLVVGLGVMLGRRRRGRDGLARYPGSAISP